MTQGGLILAAGHLRSKLEDKKRRKKTQKSRLTQNTPRHPQQPGGRDHLETAYDKTRPTR